MILSWNQDDYTPAGLDLKTSKELHQEYTKMRDALQKRFKRMLNSKYADSQLANEYKQFGLPKISEIPYDMLKIYMSQMAGMIISGESSIAELQAREKIEDAATMAMLNAGYEDFSLKLDEQLPERMRTVEQAWYFKPDNMQTRGDFWKWIKGKYSEAYLPPSSLVDEQVTEQMTSGRSVRGQHSMFGKWFSAEQNKSKYRIVEI